MLRFYSQVNPVGSCRVSWPRWLSWMHVGLETRRSQVWPVNVWLGKLTLLDMTPLGWLGHKTSTQTKSCQAWLVYLATLLQGRLSPQSGLTSIVHILSPQTDNCPSWISRMERMTVENISWSIATKEGCRTWRGSNPQLPDHQLDVHRSWPKLHMFPLKTLISLHICTSGPSCSKLTMLLVDDSLKFTSNDTQICWNVLLKKCE